VGYATSDDAAVYRLNRKEAVVQTVDFFPPVVDDPVIFGEIAAANALSDVWAMGGRPILALNLVCFPRSLPLEVLSGILEGGQRKADEAGIPILGGHSIVDDEPKYGMAVTGLVHPDRVLANVGARVGDVLVLTKPLGSGIATTAIKRGLASADLLDRAVGVMTELNRAAGEVFARNHAAVHALTDVTGYGLLGHLWEMAGGSRVKARLFLPFIPIIGDVPRLAEEGVVPGGSRANLEWLGKRVKFPRDFPESVKLVLADAQTNGGLLAALDPARAPRILAALERAGAGAHAVGEIVGGRPGIEIVI
jgi:selenide,water dikinase